MATSVKKIKLLITGIPGTGKTTFGNFLKDNFGFLHYDFEIVLCSRKLSDVNLNAMRNKDRVITWGFVPAEKQIKAVEEIVSKGFKLIWFDGDRASALREFLKRNTVPKEAFDRQMALIEKSNVIQRIKPVMINPFNETGVFKDLESIYQEIING